MKSALFQLGLLVLGTVLGLAGSIFVIRYQNQAKVIRYATYSSSGILKPLFKGSERDSINILFNNKRIKNLSEFHVYVANLDSEDLTDIPLYVELDPPNDSNLDVNILAMSFFDQNNAKEAIALVDTVASVNKNGKRFKFDISSLVRSVDYKKSVMIRFLLEGDLSPNVLVHTTKAGVRLQSGDFNEDITKADTWDSILPIITLCLAIVTVFFSITYQKKALEAYVEKTGDRYDKLVNEQLRLLTKMEMMERIRSESSTKNKGTQ